MMYVELMKNFLLADSSEQMAVRLIFAVSAQTRLFLLSRHDLGRFMKNFPFSDSSELMAVRVISASWAQKRLILTF